MQVRGNYHIKYDHASDPKLLDFIRGSEVGSTGYTGEEKEKRGQGPTKYRSDGLCTLPKQRVSMPCSTFPSLHTSFFLARNPDHPVDQIHVHGGFLAEEGDLVVDVDVCAAPASVSK